ncbi:MAG: tetratricopeptide repeat protein [Haliscomenobacter sp.]|uniref:tetratricopeptide repeat protein n=1 Tax=Haliscomenobacter sp. TaxID=2717303 RepID=UPI0029B12EA5|nr:tetratricopeptide repeat protein [Haliscomenobacter sp.]MDX2069314.1 tetratricopeptide repeat protein [Haliscomenobacter sp.]
MRSLIFTVLFLSVISLYAQEIVGNKEIDREALLIEASKEKMLGRLDKAKELYKKLLTEYPNTEAAAYELARILMLQNQPEEAVIWVSKAVTANPANVWYAILKADALQAMGQYKDAAAIYEQLARQYPTQYNYFYKWAFYLVKANELNAALKVYDDLERRSGMNENLIRLKHGLYVAQGDQKKATRELLRLAEAHPNNIDYWHNLAEYYTQNGEKEQARGVYRKILTLDANDAKANLALAGGDVNKQNDVLYLGSLRQTFESRDVSLEVKLGKISSLVEKFKNANDVTSGKELLQLSEILEQQYPKEAKPFAISAFVLSKQGKKAEAVEKMRQSLALDDTDFSHWETYFADLEYLGDMPALLKASENALDVFPNKPEVYVHAASAELALHHLSNVEDLVAQALPMSAKFPAVRQHLLSLLAMAQTQENNIAGADQNFAEALKINANSATVLAWQSLSFAQRSSGAAQALQLAQKAQQAEPQSRLATFALARAQFRSGNNSEAKNKLESLLPSANPLYLEQYGDVLFKSGDATAAVQQWGMAVTKGSVSPSLKKKFNEKQLHE